MEADTLPLNLGQQDGPSIAQQAMAAGRHNHLWSSSVTAGVRVDCDPCAAEQSKDRGARPLGTASATGLKD